LNKLFITVLLAISFSVLLGSQNAFADISTFTDKTTFLASTGATSATGPLPNLGLIPGGPTASQTVGTVTFTISPPSSELYIGAAGKPVVPGLDWTAINPGPDIAISDIENLNVNLAAPVSSLGFDIVEPSMGFDPGTGFTDTTFSFTLKNGPAIVDSFQFNVPDDVLAFVGVSSDLPFDRVEIRDITATNDDEYWGQFYTSSIPLPPPKVVGGELIPIQATSLLLTNTQSFSWMIPVVFSILGIGLFVVSRKSENS